MGNIISSARSLTRMSSGFSLPEWDNPVLVNLTSDLSQEQLLSFPAFKNWISTLRHSLSLQQNASHPFHSAPYKLRQIDIQAVDFFGKERIGFLKLKAEVSNDNDEKLPGSIFLRGCSVAMLLIVHAPGSNGANEEEYAIMTLQARIPGGSLSFAEIPAGMLDNSGTFAGAAAKEIKEETGLTIPESELTDMTSLAIRGQDSSQDSEKLQEAVYPSPGGSDESISIFVCEKELPQKELEEMQGRLTGLRKDGEKITLKLVPLKDLWKEGARDGKTLAALALYEGLKREGKL